MAWGAIQQRIIPQAQRELNAKAGEFNATMAFEQDKFDADMKLRNQLLDFLGIGRKGQATGMLGDTSGAKATQQGFLDQQLGLLGNYGAGQENRINETFDTARNNYLGNLASRGMGGSTLAGNAEEFVARGRNQGLLDLADNIVQQQVGAVGDTAGRVAGLDQVALSTNASLLSQLIGAIR